MAVVLQYDVEMLMEFSLAATPPNGFIPRWWTGEGDIDFDTGSGTETWSGTRFGDKTIMKIGGTQSSSDAVSSRVIIQVAVGDNADVTRHSIMARDLGPFDVDLYWIQRESGSGGAWTRIPRRLKGRISRSEFSGGIWEFEIENRNHDVDRQRVNTWSDSIQKAQYNGDECFSFMQSLEEGVDIDWPN